MRWAVGVMSVVALLATVSGAKRVTAVTRTVTLRGADGGEVGEAKIRSASKGVIVELRLRNLPPGEHGVHFLEHAKCEGPSFQSAGGHFNPSKKGHGMLNPGGHHNGDMPNIVVMEDGTAKANLTNPDVTLGAATDPKSLLSKGGTAIVVNAKADDLQGGSSGNSGARIACGVITP